MPCSSWAKFGRKLEIWTKLVILYSWKMTFWITYFLCCYLCWINVERLCVRQKALEDALLHSGQFKEALQAVLDWLYKVEPQLGEDQLLHGDTDTVGGLIEEHNVSLQLLTFYPGSDNFCYCCCCCCCCCYCQFCTLTLFIVWNKEHLTAPKVAYSFKASLGFF